MSSYSLSCSLASSRMWWWLSWLEELSADLLKLKVLLSSSIIIITAYNHNQLYMLKKVAYSISLFDKAPKAVQVEQPKGILDRLFSKSKKGVSYLLLKELFFYLQSTSLFANEFPFMKNNERFEESSMIVHALLLKQRMQRELELPRFELELFNYNLKTYFFPEYAQFVNPYIPVEEFSSHYSEALEKKFVIYEEELNDYNLSRRKAEVRSEFYCVLFAKLIYENRLETTSPELLKFCKYYVAHEKYLSWLPWVDMVEHKVKWGFDGEIRLINDFTSSPDAK